MRPINLAGVSYYFFPLYKKYRSKRSFLILLNGILYHSFHTNKYLRYYDIISNLFIIMYTNLTYYPSIKYSNFSIIVWTINNYLHSNRLISNNVSDIIHVFGLHLPLSTGLELALKH